MKRTPQEVQVVPASEQTQKKLAQITSQSRRKFIGKVGGLAAAAYSASAIGLSPLLGSNSQKAFANPVNNYRVTQAYQLRTALATKWLNKGAVTQVNNGDELLYKNSFIGQYSKALQHSSIGDPDVNSYKLFLNAARSGRQTDWEKCSLGGTVPLTCPQGGLAFALIGADEVQMTIPPAPTLASAERAGEMVENYWQALCRDVPASQYGQEPLSQAAIADLNKLSDFRGPKVNGQVTGQTLFRGITAGELVGPYVSQFLMMPVNGLGDFSMRNVSDLPAQLYLSYLPGLDYMTDTASWLAVQNGQATDPAKARTIFFAFGPNTYQSTPGYLTTGRDMAGVVHTDELFQHPFWAACEMLGDGIPVNPGNPYSATKTPNEIGFSAWGGPMFTGLLGHVALQAIQAVWYQKYYVHRPLRPEEYSGRVQNQLTGKNTYPLHHDVLNAAGTAAVFSKYGTYYLPMAYPEGCPTHPSYGSGHTTVAAACVTVLKALFDGSQTFTGLGLTPVYSPDGQTLQNYTGSDVNQITIGGELDKLASNIGLARNIAGVHWRSDYAQSMFLGEAVAINFLQDLVETFNEIGGSFTFTKFDGTSITIGK
ncbi:MAG TPA: vanadium-dependent haloperoxidase [Terriglobales bacterium]|nr:vanadium-dependent haloperoxidase [Terriglobales bacterium]